MIDGNTGLINETSSFEQRTLVLNSENDFRAVKGLSKYFEIRNDCFFDLNKYENGEDKSRYCSTTADYLLCFPSTPVNHTVYAKCPYKHGIQLSDSGGSVCAKLKILFVKSISVLIFSAMASKFCNVNGNWEATNYLDCIKSLVSHLYSTDCYARNKSIINSNSTVSFVETIECEDVASNDILLKIVADLYLVGFILTLFVVGTAIGIFSSIRYFWLFLRLKLNISRISHLLRSLRCVRNMIHSNLLFTFFIKSATFIPFWFFVIRNYEEIISNTSHVSLFLFRFCQQMHQQIEFFFHSLCVSYFK